MPFELLNLTHVPTAVILVFIWMLYRRVNEMKEDIKDLHDKLYDQSYLIHEIKGRLDNERR